MKINDNEFEDKVLKATKPVLVDFWAEWCGPCKMLNPILQELSEEMKDKIDIVKINIDENPNTPSKFGVRSIPTMILFKDGENLGTKLGAVPKNNLKSWIENLLV